MVSGTPIILTIALIQSKQREGHLCTCALRSCAKTIIAVWGVSDQVKFPISAVLCDPELRLIIFRFVVIDPKSLYDLFGMPFGHVLQLVWDPD